MGIIQVAVVIVHGQIKIMQVLMMLLGMIVHLILPPLGPTQVQLVGYGDVHILVTRTHVLIIMVSETHTQMMPGVMDGIVDITVIIGYRYYKMYYKFNINIFKCKL
jgi:hypothetical protein